MQPSGSCWGLDSRDGFAIEERRKGMSLRNDGKVSLTQGWPCVGVLEREGCMIYPDGGVLGKGLTRSASPAVSATVTSPRGADAYSSTLLPLVACVGILAALRSTGHAHQQNGNHHPPTNKVLSVNAPITHINCLRIKSPIAHTHLLHKRIVSELFV